MCGFSNQLRSDDVESLKENGHLRRTDGDLPCTMLLQTGIIFQNWTGPWVCYVGIILAVMDVGEWLLHYLYVSCRGAAIATFTQLNRMAYIRGWFCCWYGQDRKGTVVLN